MTDTDMMAVQPRTGTSAPHGANGSASAATQLDVAAMVRAAGAGQQQAWDQLVDRFAPTVWAIARGHRLNTADAADVSQTTWMRLVENLNRIQQPERVGAWLATTARRESLRTLRLAGRQIPGGEELDLIPDPGPPVDHSGGLIGESRCRVISALISQLPTRSQLLLRLLSAERPLSYREISEALDMPIGSIGPTRARALDQLRRLAAKAGVDLGDLTSD